MNERDEMNTTATAAPDRIWARSIGEIRVYTKNGVCMLRKPAKMIAPRGGQVLWHAFNDCGHPHAIGVEFPHEKNPLEVCYLKHPVPSHQMRPIHCAVQGDIDEDLYPYQIDVDGYLYDPELEVRGPLTENEREPAPSRDTVEVRLRARRPKVKTARPKTAKPKSARSQTVKAKSGTAKKLKAKSVKSTSSKAKSSKSKSGRSRSSARAKRKR